MFHSTLLEEGWYGLHMRIGVDLGGTKIEVLALDDDGNKLLRRRVPTPAGDYDATVAAIADLVLAVESELGAYGSVGVGTPGALSPFSGLLRNANSVVLNDQPLDRDLAHARDREVRVANDANCFALSEATDGAGVEGHTVFGVILGTGVGGGLVVDRQVLRGPNAIAGEWGHNPLPGEPDEARGCYCGRVNCVEQFLSGSAFAEEYAVVTGTALRAAQIVHSVSSDAVARTLLDRYVECLAAGLAVVINVVDPDVVVLGGGMSNTAQLYDEVPRRWGEVDLLRRGRYAAGPQCSRRFQWCPWSSLAMGLMDLLWTASGIGAYFRSRIR